jgi:acyl dehydratase
VIARFLSAIHQYSLLLFTADQPRRGRVVAVRHTRRRASGWSGACCRTGGRVLVPADTLRHPIKQRQADMSQQEVLASLQARVGQQIHLSDWFDVTQERINAFAEATGDHQWIHVDRERAARESPWKTTIAHGYLTLSLYPLLRGLVDATQPLFPGVKQVINYGLDKLRFPNAVKSGSRVRARCVLLKVEEVTGGLQMTEQYTVEIDGQAKPACVAEAIMRAYF